MAPLAGPVSAIVSWVAILWASRANANASGTGVASCSVDHATGHMADPVAAVAVLVAFGSDEAARRAID